MLLARGPANLVSGGRLLKHFLIGYETETCFVIVICYPRAVTTVNIIPAV